MLRRLTLPQLARSKISIPLNSRCVSFGGKLENSPDTPETVAHFPAAIFASERRHNREMYVARCGTDCAVNDLDNSPQISNLSLWKILGRTHAIGD
jgi:hypothetical protein